MPSSNHSLSVSSFRDSLPVYSASHSPHTQLGSFGIPDRQILPDFALIYDGNYVPIPTGFREDGAVDDEGLRMYEYVPATPDCRQEYDLIYMLGYCRLPGEFQETYKRQLAARDLKPFCAKGQKAPGGGFLGGFSVSERAVIIWSLVLLYLALGTAYTAVRCGPRTAPVPVARAPRCLAGRLMRAYTQSRWHPLVLLWSLVLLLFGLPLCLYAAAWWALGASVVRCWRRFGGGKPRDAWDAYRRAVLWTAPTGPAANMLVGQLRVRDWKDGIGNGNGNGNGNANGAGVGLQNLPAAQGHPQQPQQQGQTAMATASGSQVGVSAAESGRRPSAENPFADPDADVESQRQESVGSGSSSRRLT